MAPASALEPLQQVGGRSIQKLIRYAEDAASLRRPQRLPLPLFDHTSERNPIAGPAPGKDQHVRIKGGHRCSIGCRTGCAQKAATGGGNQLCHPGLRVDERLAPLFTVNRRWLRGAGGALRGRKRGEHFVDHRFGSIGNVENGAEKPDVVIDVGQGMRGQGEYRHSGFQDLGQGFEPVGNGSQDQVGRSGEDLLRGRRPRVRDHFQITSAQSRHGHKAVTGAGNERVETA